MQIRFKKEVEETMEVELPYYCEYAGLHKVISDNYVICVKDNKKGIEVLVSGEWLAQKGIPITKSVFDNAFQEAATNIQKLIKEETQYSRNGTPIPKDEEEEDMYREEMSQREQDHYTIEHNHLND